MTVERLQRNPREFDYLITIHVTVKTGEQQEYGKELICSLLDQGVLPDQYTIEAHLWDTKLLYTLLQYTDVQEIRAPEFFYGDALTPGILKKIEDILEVLYGFGVQTTAFFESEIVGIMEYYLLGYSYYKNEKNIFKTLIEKLAKWCHPPDIDLIRDMAKKYYEIKTRDLDFIYGFYLEKMKS